MDDFESTQPLLGNSRGAEKHPCASDAHTRHGKHTFIRAPASQSFHSSHHDVEADSSSMVPTAPLLGVQVRSASGEFKVYKRRWYILIVFSLAAATQSAVWSTFGPIPSTSEDAFGWDDSTIALLTNWGPITYLIFGPFTSWMLDVKGLRVSMILATFLVALGTGLRCITMEPPAVTWLMHVGQILNGMAGPVYMTGPVVVSSVWFPPSQRTTATAIGTLFGSIGSAACFLLGPYLVPQSAGNTTNTSCFDQSPQLINCTESDAQRIDQERKAIRFYMFIEGVWSIAIFLLVVLYFPAKPHTAPCASAAIQREDFLRGVKNILKHGQFWLACFVYGVSTGVFYAWSGVLAVILKPYNIKEKEAGWIGFYGSCGSTAAPILISWMADHLKRVMKWIVLLFYVIATASVLIFTLAVVGIIPSSLALFSLTNIIMSMALGGSVPLLFELACEMAYPTGEGTANGVMTIVNNTSCLIFLFIMMIPDIGVDWTNWAFVGSVAISIPVLLFMRTQYHRLDIDEHNPSLTAEIIIPSPHSENQESAVVSRSGIKRD